MALPRRSFLTTFGLVFLAIAGLFAADTFLAKTDKEESEVEAQRLYRQGLSLMKSGDSLKAIDRISDAIAIERGNREFLQTLAEAQFQAGENVEAQTTLTGLLTTDSTDGQANLTMARVLMKEGKTNEAVSHFHRAIYGVWRQDPEGNKRRARLELIDLLAQQNAKEELLAELLPIQESAPRDVPTRQRLGELFLLAGAPAKAAEVFRSILRDEPVNAKAHRGLGETDFAQGDYRAAQRDFEAVLRSAPGDVSARHWLDLCDELLQLDPTLRGLSTGERFKRSLELVRRVDSDVQACLQQNPPPELAQMAAQTESALKSRKIEDYEANLDLTEQLWQLRKKDCQPPPSPDSALALVLRRLAR